MSETGTLLEWWSIYFLGWKLLVRILKTSFQEFHHWFNVRSNVTHMSWMRIQFNKWIVFLRTRRYLAPNGSYCYISFSQFLWNGVLMQFYDSQNVDLSILMHEYNLQLYGRYFWVFFFYDLYVWRDDFKNHEACHLRRWEEIVVYEHIFGHLRPPSKVYINQFLEAHS